MTKFTDRLCLNEWNTCYEIGRYGNMWPAEEIVRVLYELKKMHNKGLDAHVMDLGCGLGRHCWAASLIGYKNVTGVDLSPSAIDGCRDRLNSLGCSAELHVSDARNLSLGADVIICYSVIDHIFKDLSHPILKAANEVLKPGGYFICVAKGKGDSGFGSGECVEDDTYVRYDREHERGIPQSFYDKDEFQNLITGAGYELCRCETLIRRVESGGTTEKYLALAKKV